MNCTNCGIPMPNHTYEGLFDCLAQLGKINKKLLGACKEAHGFALCVYRNEELWRRQAEQAMKSLETAVAAAEGNDG